MYYYRLYYNDIMKYLSSFKLFTTYSDEKSRELELIKKYLGLKQRKNLLDIGGGNAILTRGLYSYFDEIEVLEKNSDFKDNYKEKKFKLYLNSIEEFSTNNKFSIVIASHIFPYIEIEERGKILQKLIGFLEEGGILLILEMTRHGHLETIKRNIYEDDFKSTYEILKEIFILEKIKYKELTFRNRVSTDDLKKMIEIIGFFSEKYNGQFLRKKEMIGEYISKNLYNKKDDKYTLYYTNKLILIKK